MAKTLKRYFAGNDKITLRLIGKLKQVRRVDSNEKMTSKMIVVVEYAEAK